MQTNQPQFTQYQSYPYPTIPEDGGKFQLSSKTPWEMENDITGIKSTFVNLEDRIATLEKTTPRNRYCISTQISDLDSTKYRLRCPIPVLITFEDKTFFAEPPDFELFGTGSDAKSAVNDLKDVIVVYYENLRESPETLSKALKIKLQLLNKIIEDEGPRNKK
jgi:predicted RNase H-like HicB family nuclease